MKLALEGKENKAMPGTTTQLAKSRQPPLWSGQQFEVKLKWKDGMKTSLVMKKNI